MKKILFITDTWKEPINGVIVTLNNLISNLKNKGYDVDIIHPYMFKTIPCPKYPELPLAYNIFDIFKTLKSKNFDYAHIVTEGPIGLTAKYYFEKHNINFTTSYHTCFPEFLKDIAGVPKFLTYFALKKFHNNGYATFVPTTSIKKRLENKGFKNVVVWTRGIDRDQFNLNNFEELNYKRPILLNVGRVSKEKNLKDFYNIKTEGTKIQIGSGPDIEEYKNTYKDVVFLGEKKGKELAKYFASSDVFVFPSINDTFGLVLLEAAASGTPIAAYPVPSPIDVINHNMGCMSNDLNDAVEKCLKISRKDVVDSTSIYNWHECIDTFLNEVKK